jgi:hypothetical protein
MCVYLIYIYEIYCQLFQNLSLENALTAAVSTGHKADRASALRVTAVCKRNLDVTDMELCRATQELTAYA